jgi:D-glycero-alpha-D-manno-heptose 1-phosphate guanylyltransferase
MLQTAIILAGGYGTRLQSVVSDVPKPMAPVNNEPFLNYQLRYLKHFGIQNIILSVGYLSEKIMQYYGPSFEGMGITYVTEESPLGTGGGIRLAMEDTADETVLTLNGDSFFDVDLHEFYALHNTGAANMSLALRQVDNAARYGTIVCGNEQRIISFREKDGVEQPGLINGGVYLLNRQLYLNNTPAAKNFSIEKDFFETQLTQLIIKGFEFPGYFIDIGIPEDYTKAQHDLKGFTYR